MSTTGKTVVVDAAGIEVVCRELNVGQVRGLMSKSRGESFQAVELMFKDIPLDDLTTFTSLTKEQVEDMKPSDLEKVVNGCKEANPHFFALMARLDALRSDQ